MNSLSMFYRRLDDAFCALIHGHTRRDWNRVRLRRLRLLVQREISRLEREALRYDYQSFCATNNLLSAQALACRLESIVNRVDCEAYGILSNQLQIDRFNLHARRKFQWDDWHALDDLDKARIQRPVMPVVHPDSKQYGKFFKGLGERLTFDPLHDKRRFYIWYWHWLFAPIFRLFARLFRSARVISPP